MRGLVTTAVRLGQDLRVPAAVVAQVWRHPARQARLASFLGGTYVQHVPMDLLTAKAAGLLCQATGTTDVVDAAVAACARLYSDYVVTSDPIDMRRLVRPDRVLVI